MGVMYLFRFVEISFEILIVKRNGTHVAFGQNKFLALNITLEKFILFCSFF